MTTSPSKPSDIDVSGVPFLVGTLKRTEAEMCAGLMVRALQVSGDSWRPLGWAEVSAAILADIEAGTGPWARLVQNPFFNPSLPELMKEHKDPGGGTYRFAEWADEENRLVRFTERGIAAMLGRTCRDCECFDGGGLGPCNKPRNSAGDCHNPKSGRFTVYESDTCDGFRKDERP